MAEHGRRFGAVVALVIGAFLALTLLPVNVTGPFGALLGPGLWRMLGLGALGAPLLGILIGLAGFDRLPRLDMKRAAILVIGLALVIPYVIGVLGRVETSSFDLPTAQWPWPELLTGWLPGFFARSALDLIGVAGGLLAGFVALTRRHARHAGVAPAPTAGAQQRARARAEVARRSVACARARPRPMHDRAPRRRRLAGRAVHRAAAGASARNRSISTT